MLRFSLTVVLAIMGAVAAFAQSVPPTNTGALPVSQAGASPTGAPFVVVCPMEGEITLGLAAVIERAAKEAQGADAFILEIDTPGGRVDAALDIASTLLDLEMPVYAWITGTGAISAGAIISYACNVIYMDAATSFGASTPFMPGVETDEAIDEKSSSFVRSKYRAFAEENGHDPNLGEAMVDRNLVVYGWRDGDGEFRTVLGTADENAQPVRPAEAPEEAKLVSAPGSLLTLTTEEAIELGLAKGKARSLENMLEQEGLSAVRVVKVEINWAEALFAFLTNPIISGLLLMMGLGGLYVEIRTPGLGLPGILGLICLALFFGSNAVLGLAGWVDLALVAVGLSLILVEVLVLPGFGFAGIGGIVCLVTGLYLSLTRIPIPQYEWDYQRINDAATTLGVGISTFALFVIVSFFVLPRTPMFRWLTLANAQDVDAGYIVQTEAEERAGVGLRGVATSVLRPAGRGRFDGVTMDIVTRGEYIERGRPVRIIEVEGNRYVVEEVKEERPNG
jgi:membrane-bound serine protease (ClpP class)